jgi:hypothetical protein
MFPCTRSNTPFDMHAAAHSIMFTVITISINCINKRFLIYCIIDAAHTRQLPCNKFDFANPSLGTVSRIRLHYHTRGLRQRIRSNIPFDIHAAHRGFITTVRAFDSGNAFVRTSYSTTCGAPWFQYHRPCLRQITHKCSATVSVSATIQEVSDNLHFGVNVPCTRSNIPFTLHDVNKSTHACSHLP